MDAVAKVSTHEFPLQFKQNEEEEEEEEEGNMGEVCFRHGLSRPDICPYCRSTSFGCFISLMVCLFSPSAVAWTAGHS